MAKEKAPQFTHEQDLGPGVTRTPGYPIEEAQTLEGMADRRVDRYGVAAEHPILSTYDGPQNGLQPGPDTKVPKPRLEITEVDSGMANAESTVATPAPPKPAAKA